MHNACFIARAPKLAVVAVKRDSVGDVLTRYRVSWALSGAINPG